MNEGTCATHEPLHIHKSAVNELHGVHFFLLLLWVDIGKSLQHMTYVMIYDEIKCNVTAQMA